MWMARIKFSDLLHPAKAKRKNKYSEIFVTPGLLRWGRCAQSCNRIGAYLGDGAEWACQLQFCLRFLFFARALTVDSRSRCGWQVSLRRRGWIVGKNIKVGTQGSRKVTATEKWGRGQFSSSQRQPWQCSERRGTTKPTWTFQITPGFYAVCGAWKGLPTRSLVSLHEEINARRLTGAFVSPPAFPRASACLLRMSLVFTFFLLFGGFCFPQISITIMLSAM